jgi:type I restriction enzyme S subunit
MFRFDFSDAAYISPETHQEMRRSWVKHGDVLLNITGASIGRVNFYEGEDDRANVNQHVCIIRPDRTKLLPEFLTYHLGTATYQNLIVGQNTGATRQAFTFSQIREFDVIRPHIALQARFSSAIDAVTSLRDELTSALLQTEQLFGSLQQRAFYGEMFDDASAS